MPATMLLRKLEQVLALSRAERQTIEELPEHVLHVQRREDIVNGSRPTSVHLLRTGIAGRYTLLGEGQRQITAFLVPGDCCDLRALLMGDMDHSVAAFAPVRWPSYRISVCLLPSKSIRGSGLRCGVTLCSMLRSIGIGWPTSAADLPTPGLLTCCVKSGSG